MAKKNSASDVERAFTEGTESKHNFRSFKNDGSGFDELKEGQEIEGTLVSIRDHQIKDKRTKQMKDIRVYSIRTENETLKIGGRTILDRLCDEIMDEHDGYSVNNRQYSGPGYDWLRGRVVRFVRGQNSETSDGNPLGTYEILVAED